MTTETEMKTLSTPVPSEMLTALKQVAINVNIARPVLVEAVLTNFLNGLPETLPPTIETAKGIITTRSGNLDVDAMMKGLDWKSPASKSTAVDNKTKEESGTPKKIQSG